MPAARHRGREDGLRRERDRTRIAQAAAKLIALHGITDWTLAKRKAARQLMLAETAALPSNDEIEDALKDHHALFGGGAHHATLRRQRLDALEWMRRLAQWEPLLVGGVAAGWASEHSDVRLELVADDPKSVEMALASGGVSYAALPPRADDPVAHLRIDAPRALVRLAILTPQQRRNRPRHDDAPRLNASAVAALLASEAPDALHGAP
ncbi:MAG: hypothetical protein ABI724_13955 [Betaproteobacteria bacterium]